MSEQWVDYIRHFLGTLDGTILVYFLIVNSFYTINLVAAAWEMWRQTNQIRGAGRHVILSSRVAPTISILAPAFNEAATITESVRSLMTLSYPNLEVVVINDGSKDETVSVLVQNFDLFPIHPNYEQKIHTKPVRTLYRSRRHGNLVVVDKENGGKADALNVGVNFASGQLVCTIDADTLVESDSLLRMVRPFLLSDQLVAAGGNIRAVNDSLAQNGRIIEVRAPRTYYAGIQVIEYLRAFLLGRLGLNRMGGNLIISGAFGLFRREAMLAAGGYQLDTVGEDMELVVRLRRRGFETGGPSQVELVPDPTAWTEVPESRQVLGRQRDRWHRGLVDVLWRHRTMFLNPRYGAVGLVVFPYFVFVELLAPVMEMCGLIGLVIGLSFGLINLQVAWLFFLLAYGYGILLSAFTLLLEELSFHRHKNLKDRFILLGWLLLENLGYRQMSVVWRLKGLKKYMSGNTQWGVITRKGFGTPKPTGPTTAAKTT
ncbi:MAG: glycosyltransferase family 2 protein [Candidatus Binatia bacterium]